MRTIYLVIFSLLSCFPANMLAAPQTQRDALAQVKHYCKQKGIKNNQIATSTHIPTGDSLLQVAETYQHLGHYHKSIAVLCVALENTSETNSLHKAIILGSLGYAYFIVGETEKAVALLEDSVNRATALKQPGVAAVALNNLGNVYATYPEPDKRNKALMYYRDSAALATQAGNNMLVVKAMVNWVQTQLENASTFQDIENELFNILKKSKHIDVPHQQIQVQLRVGQLILLTYKQFPSHKADLLPYAYQMFNDALTLAQEHKNRRATSQALGYLAQLYMDKALYAEALTLTRQAIFNAQEINAHELLYYWQWQSGRLLKKQGQNDDAISAYQQAVNTLLSIRYDLSTIYRASRSSFRDKVGAVFLELADLLLQQAASSSPSQRKDYLKDTQDTLEKLKGAELLDYFQNECVIDAQVELDDVGLLSGTAVLYPIIFDDRLELLLRKKEKDDIVRRTVPINKDELNQKVNEFREKIEETFLRTPFLTHAQTLYDWLIRPIENELEGVDTLVFVPDGILRTLPIAALHNGTNYLIHDYALAVVPGLTLTLSDSSEAKQNDIHILLAGLKLHDLPNTEIELERIKNQVQAASDKNSTFVELLNEQFTKSNLEQELIKTAHFAVHISSHAAFKADIKETYILTGEGRLLLDQFENSLAFNRIHDSSLNLITLSACEAALGDDRAALGLGGIALRAGAQSAVATLWQVEQSFPAQLMPIFYEYVSNGKLSKAQALRQAQLEMMKESGLYYDHPYFWAAFILIGNWL